MTVLSFDTWLQGPVSSCASTILMMIVVHCVIDVRTQFVSRFQILCRSNFTTLLRATDQRRYAGKTQSTVTGIYAKRHKAAQPKVSDVFPSASSIA